MKNEEIKKLAIDLKIELNDEELKEVSKEFDRLNQMIDVFDSIDTSDVEEMIYPFNVETTFLREDEPDYILSQDDALANGSKLKQGHFVVPKVVK